MVNEKKVTIKSLSDEISTLKEKLKEMDSLKEIVAELTKKVKNLEKNNDTKTSPKELNCRKCDKKYNSMKTLRIHIREAHPQKIKCEHCDDVFDTQYKLEIHIKEKHELPTYSCEKCTKEFVTQW